MLVAKNITFWRKPLYFIQYLIKKKAFYGSAVQIFILSYLHMRTGKQYSKVFELLFHILRIGWEINKVKNNHFTVATIRFLECF